jgi:hypothetical protein
VRKSIQNLLWGAGSAAVVVAAGVGVFCLCGAGVDPQEVLESLARTTPSGRLVVEYPLDGTLFPPEIRAPTVRWKEENVRADLWLVTIAFPNGRGRIDDFAPESEWRPQTRVWEEIKSRCVEGPAAMAVIGINRQASTQALSAGRVTIRTSSDKVGAPLFYREVNLPFGDAVRDPSAIRWRFGEVSSVRPPPIVLQNLPVCGNCHSFSTDGAVLGMDIDYANDKGSYAIAAVSKSMTRDKNTIITWSDYKRDEREPTFGLLSQVSPDGRFVVSTVKDESVFVPQPGLDFSQLFFPVKGILCIYDRQMGTFQSLPHPLQRRPRRQGRAAGGGLLQRQEQLLPEVFPGWEMDRVLPGRELHAAPAAQRVVHHSRRGGRSPAAARQHQADELLAQLLPKG